VLVTSRYCSAVAPKASALMPYSRLWTSALGRSPLERTLQYLMRAHFPLRSKFPPKGRQLVLYFALTIFMTTTAAAARPAPTASFVVKLHPFFGSMPMIVSGQCSSILTCGWILS